MKTEKIKTYCIVGMDNVKGLDTDIQSISIAPATLIMGARQVGLVGVFQSKLDPDRIKDVLNIGSDRSFFISELNPATFSAHIDIPNLHELFFGEFDKHQKQYVRIKNRVEDFISSGFTDSSIIQNNIEYDEEQLSSLSEDQRSLLMDKLLTNVDKLTNNQKKVLNFLASL
jgi:hypothetical protein